MGGGFLLVEAGRFSFHPPGGGRHGLGRVFRGFSPRPLTLFCLGMEISTRGCLTFPGDGGIGVWLVPAPVRFDLCRVGEGLFPPHIEFQTMRLVVFGLTALFFFPPWSYSARLLPPTL